MFGAVLNRLATSVRRALSQYAVGANEPELALNFIDNEYITNNSTSTFASAVTHARAGNATMTDGYGPELVTNGGFDSGTDSWTASNADFSVSDGIAYFKSTGANGSISQTISTVAGKLYEITFNGKYSSGDQSNVEIEGVLEYPNSIGITSSVTSFTQFRGVFTATGSSHVIKLRERGGANNASAFIDSVSVREMPVLKWAPHNLLTYSEQFDNAAWPKTDTTITANAAIAPDGTQTADEITHTSAAPSFSRAVSPVEDGVNYTHSVFVKYIDHQWIRIGHDSASSPFGTWFDVQNGVIGTKGSNHVSSSIEDVGNGWYKLTVEGTADGTSFSTYILLANADGGTGKVAGTSAYIWGAHLYRSDLGGMVDNPDQPSSRASYVPTTSAAKYLPRIGHHVYNGSAWVNEGLLAESEARTNLTALSTPDSTWSKSATTITENDIVSPDGNENASKIVETTATSNHFVYYSLDNISYVSGTTYTQSAVLKKGTRQYVQLLGTSVAFGANAYANFDLSDGTVGSVGSGVSSTTVENLGNGWYRCSMTADAIITASGNNDIIASVTSKTAARSESFAGSTSNYFYVYHAQTEQASTPSSLIPTSGSTVSRAAETFTIPSANLPWPTPQYIGDELVTNGTFDTDSDWIISSADPVSGISGGQLFVESAGSNAQATQGVAVSANKVYKLSYDLIAEAGTGLAYVRLGGVDLKAIGASSIGTNEVVFVPDGSSTTFKFMTFSNDGASFTLDNVSVREINPLSVSIGMEGRMTYADTDSASEHLFLRWLEDGSNQFVYRLFTDSTNTGGIKFVVAGDGTVDSVQTSGTLFSPDILVPYNIAGRHGSTFVNGAVDGVALTADTTPTALPDLSSTDLELAYDYMGTISEFRVWDKDITDAGLVEATNPSLEPSLSLTFEGTGTNSFVVNNWSE